MVLLHHRAHLPATALLHMGVSHCVTAARLCPCVRGPSVETPKQGVNPLVPHKAVRQTTDMGEREKPAQRGLLELWTSVYLWVAWAHEAGADLAPREMDRPLPNDGGFGTNCLYNGLFSSQFFIWIQYFLLNDTLAD